MNGAGPVRHHVIHVIRGRFVAAGPVHGFLHRWVRIPVIDGSAIRSASGQVNQNTSWLSSGGGAGSASSPSRR